MLCYVSTTTTTTIIITTTITTSPFQLLMVVLYILLGLSSCHLADSLDKTITAAVFGTRRLVGEGEAVTLSCVAPRDWILCAWKAPGGEKFCLLRLEDGHDVELCGNTTTPG